MSAFREYFIAFVQWLLLLIITFVVASCSIDEPENPPKVTDKTVLVYMVADNDLGGYANKDLSEMKAGMRKQGVPENCRWIVYYSGGDGAPRLIEIERTGQEKVLMRYTKDELSVSVSRMRKVVADMKILAPAESYGMVLWSHGTGWQSESGALSVELNGNVVSAPHSFGWDGVNAYRMKITSLAEALSGMRFDFLYFDCCHMATVEVAYELRGVSDVMVGCAPELGVDGMPYDLNVKELLKGDCESAARNTFGVYSAEFATGKGYGCSISLLNLSALDGLADATRKVFAVSVTLPSDYTPVKYYREVVLTGGLYDFNHYVKALCGDKQALYQQWQRELAKVVEYHATTNRVYGLVATNFSGLACNIVHSKEDLEPQNDNYGYRETSWCNDIVKPFFK